jgi:O-antigen/teichoic acid export membrane protein
MSQSLWRNTLFYLPAQFLGPLVQFALVVAWTHLLDPAAFGVVTFVVAAQEMTALFGLIWWSIYMLRFRQRHVGAQAARFLAMDSRMVAAGAAGQILMAPFCLVAIGAEATPALVAALAAYLVVRLLLGHYSEWARSDHRIAAYSVAQIAAPALGALFSVAAILRFGPAPAVTLAALAAGQAIAVAGLMTALRRAPELGVLDRAIFADAARFGLPLVAAGGFAWIAANGVRILVQNVDGVVAVGLLSAGWGLGQRISSVIAMVCTAAAFPLAVDRMEAGDRDGALHQVAINGALMFALLAPASVGLALLAGPLVDLMIAADYREITRVVMPLAMVAGAVRTLRMHTADQVCLLLDRTRVSMLSNFADAAMATLCAAIGIYLADIVGAAAGSLVGTLVASTGSIAYAAARMRLRLDFGVWARIAAASAAMALALRLFPAPAGIVAIAAHIVLGALVYALALLALMPGLRAAIGGRLSRRRGAAALDSPPPMAENDVSRPGAEPE